MLTPVQSQDITLSGYVTAEKTGKPLAQVSVMLKHSGEARIEKYTQTDSAGHFQLTASGPLDARELCFSLLGYAARSVALTDMSSPLKIALSEKAIALEEVVIKAPRIRPRGDTLIYDVSRFADARDKTIGDVLKKMPGITVESSGAIKYNGIPIDKFYVEGLDLLGGRYGIATRNIPQQSVSRVEVLENHQVVKALRKLVHSDQAALNLKLKAGAKAKWVGTLKPGVGASPFLWQLGLFAMRFGARSQSMNAYKSNNIGKDIVGETRSFALEDMRHSADRYRLTDHIDLEPAFVNYIDEERLHFNKTHAFNTTNLWKLSDDYQLRGQLCYVHDRLTRGDFVKTTYFIEDSARVVEERNDMRTAENQLATALTWTANTDKFYIEDALTLDFSWRDVRLITAGTQPADQSANLPDCKVVNDFRLVKRIGSHAIGVNSHNQFSAKPHEIDILRDETRQAQEVKATAFFSNSNLSYALREKKLGVFFKGGCSLLLRDMENNLRGTLFGGLSDRFKSSFNYIHPYLKTSLEYRESAFSATFAFPVHYYRYRYTDKRGNVKRSNPLFIPLQLNLRYDLTPRFSLYASGQYGKEPVSDAYFYSGAILQDYRYSKRGIIDYSMDRSQSIRFGLKYKNPVDALFSNLSLSRSKHTSARVPKREFIGDYMVMSYVPTARDNGAWQVSGELSKGIGVLHGLITANASFSAIESALYQQGVIVPYGSDLLVIQSRFDAEITDRLHAKYELAYFRDLMRLKNGDADIENDRFKQALSVAVTPIKKLRFQFSGVYYHNEIAAGTSKDLFIADASVVYSTDKSWEISGSLRNISNRNRYSYAINDALSAVYREYAIRPRELVVSLFFKL